MQECLIFDADDTLWENNIYFHRAISEFLDLIAPMTSDRQRVQNLLSDIEKESIPQRGYGSRNFIHALKETFRCLYSGEDGRANRKAIEEIGDRLLNHPIELLPGVASTLQMLRHRYRLMLFTKGDCEEQSDKLERSGLKAYFDRIEVVEEKHTDAYRGLILRHSLPPDSTCMIGNSPRSDVLPALAAGLWAIFIPHPHTWELEEQQVPPHPRLRLAPSIQALPPLLSALFPPGE